MASRSDKEVCMLLSESHANRIDILKSALFVFLVVLQAPFIYGADHFVADSADVPCVLWCRGCCPTSASMVLGYWDRGNGGGEWEGYGRLIDYWREYTKYSDGTGSLINVPNTLEELRVDMGTAVDGSTNPLNICPGIEAVCNSRNGYNFNCDMHICTLLNDWQWAKMQSEINNDRPFVYACETLEVSPRGHCIAVWGYTDAKYIINYNTWSCGRDDWYYKTYGDGTGLATASVNTVIPGGGEYGQTSLTTPDGGEDWKAGDVHNIVWHEFDERIWSADLSYSTDGGVNWTFITTVEPSSPGWKTYAWTVPSTITTKTRVRISNFSGGGSDPWVLRCADGSEANFTISQEYDPPTPNPMQWSTEPHATSGGFIHMVAATATDASPPIEYMFFYGGNNSAWQASREYLAGSLAVNTAYSCTARARDRFDNRTGYAPTRTVYTYIEEPTAIDILDVTASSMTVKTNNSLSNLTSSNSGVKFRCWVPGVSPVLVDESGWLQLNEWTKTSMSPNKLYMFNAISRNGDEIETAYCEMEERYTLANLPGQCQLTNITVSSVDITINPNGNPSPTEYTIIGYNYSTNEYFYLDQNGNNNGATAVWQTNADWGIVTAQDLTYGTLYGFWAKARNGDGVQTGWPAGATAQTLSPSITVTSPNGGEIWDSGFYQALTWTSQNLPGNVQIEISYNNGGSWSTISSATSNDGVYSWLVQRPESNECLIRISSLTYPEISDTSNGTFTINGVIFVDVDATGGQNGSSWYNAFHDLQNALGIAVNGDEIRVAEGMYKPDTGTNQSETFQLVNGVRLLGGYLGYGHAWPNTRLPDVYVTIMSGDLLGDDGPDFTNMADNSSHIVTGIDLDSTTALDGFTIQSGNVTGTWGAGAGMRINNSSLSINQCTFTKNRASDVGAGMLVGNSDAMIMNCTFMENYADNAGAGMHVSSLSTCTILDCFFDNNFAYWGGGGVFIAGASPVIVRCTFTGNESAAWGGAIHNDRVESHPEIMNCMFLGNQAKLGGAVYHRVQAQARITNCAFIDNYAIQQGGAVYSKDSGTFNTMINCSFYHNRADGEGGGVAIVQSSTCVINNSVLYDNSDYYGQLERSQIYNAANLAINNSCVEGWTGTFGGVGNIGENPQWQDPDGPDNVLGTLDDNLRLTNGSPCLDEGSNASLPPDIPDMDGDSNTTEPIPLDLDNNTRIFDTDCHLTADVDMGAYEYSLGMYGDFNNDCRVNLVDYAMLAQAWLATPEHAAWHDLFDIGMPADSIISMEDLQVLCDHWLDTTE